VKHVEACVQSFFLESIVAALCSLGIPEVVVTEMWRQDVTAPTGRHAAKAPDLRPRVLLQVVVHDDLVERVVDAIRQVAGHRAAAAGGLVLVGRVESAVRIPSGQIDEAALW
jgi:nitrogen regulatory protein P-II 1